VVHLLSLLKASFPKTPGQSNFFGGLNAITQQRYQATVQSMLREPFFSKIVWVKHEAMHAAEGNRSLFFC
jgi:hypothetical protein